MKSMNFYKKEYQKQFLTIALILAFYDQITKKSPGKKTRLLWGVSPLKEAVFYRRIQVVPLENIDFPKVRKQHFHTQR